MERSGAFARAVPDVGAGLVQPVAITPAPNRGKNMKSLAAALVLSTMAGGAADINPFLPPPPGMSHAEMPPVLFDLDDGQLLPVTDDLWHPEFSTPDASDEIRPIESIALEPVTLQRAQECLHYAVGLIEYGMVAYVRWVEADCHMRGLGWSGWESYDMPEYRYDLEWEDLPEWSEDAFYRPKPENFLLPNLHEAQACIAYMVWRADTGDHNAPSDKFCALRGLYLNSIDSIH